MFFSLLDHYIFCRNRTPLGLWRYGPWGRTDCEDVVGVRREGNLHHRVAVRKQRLVAIAKVQAPYLQRQSPAPMLEAVISHSGSEAVMTKKYQALPSSEMAALIEM